MINIFIINKAYTKNKLRPSWAKPRKGYPKLASSKMFMMGAKLFNVVNSRKQILFIFGMGGWFIRSLGDVQRLSNIKLPNLHGTKIKTLLYN